MSINFFNRKLIIFIFFTTPIFTAENSYPAETAHTQAFLQELVEQNGKFVGEFDKQGYQDALSKQTPRVTLLMCADSRLQTELIDPTPFNDIFMVRNIGNQMGTVSGSVEYGVLELKTPILLILGHTMCGAIQACKHGLAGLPKEIQQELSSVHINNKITLTENIIDNIHRQVAFAVSKFSHLIESKQLVVIGAIDDLHNEYKQGNGRFIVVNANNEKDPAILKKNPALSGLKHGTFLPDAK